MRQDPVIKELHRQRRQHSNQFRQDLAAMAENTRQRAQILNPAPRVKRAARSPKRLADAA